MSIIFGKYAFCVLYLHYRITVEAHQHAKVE